MKQVKSPKLMILFKQFEFIFQIVFKDQMWLKFLSESKTFFQFTSILTQTRDYLQKKKKNDKIRIN